MCGFHWWRRSRSHFKDFNVVLAPAPCASHSDTQGLCCTRPMLCYVKAKNHVVRFIKWLVTLVFKQVRPTGGKWCVWLLHSDVAGTTLCVFPRWWRVCCVFDAEGRDKKWNFDKLVRHKLENHMYKLAHMWRGSFKKKIKEKLTAPLYRTFVPL